MLPLGAAKPPYCVHSPRIPSPLHTLWILVATPLTVPRLPVVSLYRPFLTVLPSLPALLPPRASLMSHIIPAVLDSLWSVSENPCVLRILSSPLPPKVPKSLNHTVTLLVPPPYKTFPKTCGPPLPVVAVFPSSPRPSVYIYKSVRIYESVCILSIKQALSGGVESGGIKHPKSGVQTFSNINKVGSNIVLRVVSWIKKINGEVVFLISWCDVSRYYKGH